MKVLTTPPNKRKFEDMNTCATCIHLGLLKGRAGVCKGHVCLAPITTNPPKDGETLAEFPFVYETEVDGLCEMYCERKKNT